MSIGTSRPNHQSRPSRPPTVLAVASAGGHWVQLFRLRPAWDGCSVAYLTTNFRYRDQVMSDADERSQPGPRFFTAVSANRWQKLRLLYQCLQVVTVVIRVHPDVVITTGAAPGYLAIRAARWIGARTIWIDSIANAQELSLSGKRVGRYSDLWLTQWKHLEGSERPGNGQPLFRGATL
jgi:UDP-N-acetylglucosamine:LPS N-acetylglucosamine transferase